MYNELSSVTQVWCNSRILASHPDRSFATMCEIWLYKRGPSLDTRNSPSFAGTYCISEVIVATMLAKGTLLCKQELQKRCAIVVLWFLTEMMTLMETDGCIMILLVSLCCVMPYWAGKARFSQFDIFLWVLHQNQRSHNVAVSERLCYRYWRLIWTHYSIASTVTPIMCE